MNNKHYFAFLLIFFMSGFSGLIYESIWTHYLKLFLGHAAYAQVLVLCIFMGGIAIGSFFAANYTDRWKKLFFGYAIVEGVIGVFAVFFHEFFVAFLDLSYNTILQNLGSPISVNIYKWFTSALLILPQSILLGTTFPLMAAAILRTYPKQPGEKLSIIYFINSFGAAIGVLVSGFYMIKTFGLPDTIRVAGVINIFIAITVIILSGKHEKKIKIQAIRNNPSFEKISKNKLLIFLITASFFTGMASFIYEIAWIRMLNLVLGTSTHAFELMLSAFIFGLAFGGLWIRKRIDKIQKPISYLGFIQITMGVMATLTLLLYNNTFNFMHWVMETAPKTDIGYFYFNLASNGIAFLIMLPATFCAGMTLPLITTILLKKQGEKSIGSVYAWNTVGAIVGIIFAIQIGMQAFGVKGLVCFGAGIDLLVGVVLLFVVNKSKSIMKIKTIVSSAALIVLIYTTFFFSLNTYKMASGVYRGNNFINPNDSEILYHADGKTASVTTIFDKQLGNISIRTNGKSDASVSAKEQIFGTIDDITTIQLGVIPMALNPSAKNVGIIGLGAGVTTKLVLANPNIKAIHTVEIEEAIVNAAKYIGPQIVPVFTDPRSKIIIDDAKSYFASNNLKYDIIISEPSNPWVSGISSLFTTEYYDQIQKYLNTDGIFAQWVHLYNMDIDLVISILKAVSENFQDYGIYILNNNNCLIVAKKEGELPALDKDVLNIPAIAESLKRIKVHSIQDIEFRFIGNKKIIDPLLADYTIPANSDYYPVLDQNATRARFLGNKATDIYSFSHFLHPVVSLLCEQTFRDESTNVAINPFYSLTRYSNEAISLRDYFLYDDFELNFKLLPEQLRQEARAAKEAFNDNYDHDNINDRARFLFNMSTKMTPYLTTGEMKRVWESIVSNDDETLTVNEHLWLSLFVAIADRNAKRMITLGESLLNQNNNIPVVVREYIVSAVMIGCIIEGQTDKAQIIWHSNKNQLSNDSRSKMLFKLLLANSKK